MSRCILIVDDDPVILRLVSLSLSISEFDVIEAKDGEAGLRAMRSHRIAAVILDLQMPGKGGMNVLRTMKSDPALSAIPVMILTADRDNEMVIKLLRAGAADYLVKPFDPDQLLERINRLAIGLVPSPKLPEQIWEV